MREINSAYTAISGVLHEFWSNLGVPAFLENEAPKGFKEPFIAYSFSLSKAFQKSEEKAALINFDENSSNLSEILLNVEKALPEEGAILKLTKNLGYIRLTRSNLFIISKPHLDNLSKIKVVYYGLTVYI